MPPRNEGSPRKKKKQRGGGKGVFGCEGGPYTSEAWGGTCQKTTKNNGRIGGSSIVKRGRKKGRAGAHLKRIEAGEELVPRGESKAKDDSGTFSGVGRPGGKRGPLSTLAHYHQPPPTEETKGGKVPLKRTGKKV